MTKGYNIIFFAFVSMCYDRNVFLSFGCAFVKIRQVLDDAFVPNI